MNDGTDGRMPAAHQDDTFDLDLPGGERLLTAGTVAPPSADVLARALAVVDAAVERELRDADPQDAPAATTPARHRLLRRRWIVSAALVAAAATGIAVLPTVSFDGKPAASANAATFLNELADRTEAASPITAVGRLKGAPYWEIMTLGTGGNPEPEPTTTYISVKDGSERLYLGTSGEYMKVTNAVPTMHWWLGGRKTVDLAGLDRLPTDTAHLKAALTGQHNNVAVTFANVIGLLESPASPKLRAALFRVLSQLPGIQLDGTRKDFLGRSGTQISMKLPGPEFYGEWETLLVQPGTGTLLQHDRHEPTSAIASHTADTYLWTGPARRMPRDLSRR